MNAPISEQITRKSASNLALAFILLPREKRQAMSALYAFCREVDDIADEETRPVDERRELLALWRRDIQAACLGGQPELQVNRELQPHIRSHRLPLSLFEALLDGVEMDLEPRLYPDLPAIEHYCYHVASVVGLLSIEIFGYTDPASRDYAVALGKALQFTNILRDVGGDAARGRVYLPESEMAAFGISPGDVLERRDSEGLRALARSFAGRAQEFYREARVRLPRRDRQTMVAAELMGTVYWNLLRRLERLGYPVMAEPPVRLSRARKLALTAFAWLRVRSGLPFSPYGG